MKDSDRRLLLRRQEEGKPVPMLDRAPALPVAVRDLWRGFWRLRRATPGDEPISWPSLESYMRVWRVTDVDLFSRMVQDMDDVFFSEKAKLREESEQAKPKKPS